jgi:hypothetical protein
MAKRLMGWFSTPSDLQRVAAELDAAMTLRYVWAWYLETPEIRTCSSIAEFPHAGFSRIYPLEPGGPGDPYFAIDPETEIHQLNRPLHVRPGEQVMHWYLDAERMKDAVVMNVPGMNRSARALVDGELVAMSSSHLASTIIRTMLNAIRKSHVRRGNGLVGPEAWELAQQGWRMCHNLNQPPEYDYDLGLRSESR